MALQDYLIDTSGQATPDQVKRRQAYADALTKGGQDYSPVQSPWQGAARLAQGLLGGYERGQANVDEAQGRAGYQQRLAAALQGKDVSPQAVITAAGDPWANPAQISALSHTVDMQAQKARQGVEDSHWAASYALQKHASERADDKTPAGFMADPANPGSYVPIPNGPADPAYLANVAKAKAAPPDGYKINPDGSMSVITGGPSDPETLKKIAEAKRGPDSSFDDETIAEMAKQARAGDTSVFTNIGRGAQGPENLSRLRKEITRQNKDEGVSGSEQALRNAEFFGVKAGQRVIGGKGANIEMAATEFNQVLPVVQAASQAVPRTNYPDLNKIIQMGEAKTGDPNVVKLGGGVNTLINLYARAISPSGTPTVSDKDHAREILSAAWSQGQFDAAVGMMQQEIKAALASPEKVRDEMRSRFLRGQGAAPVGYPAPGAPKSTGPVSIDGYTITEH